MLKEADVDIVTLQLPAILGVSVARRRLDRFLEHITIAPIPDHLARRVRAQTRDHRLDQRAGSHLKQHSTKYLLWNRRMSSDLRLDPSIPADGPANAPGIGRWRRRGQRWVSPRE